MKHLFKTEFHTFNFYLYAFRILSIETDDQMMLVGVHVHAQDGSFLSRAHTRVPLGVYYSGKCHTVANHLWKSGRQQRRTVTESSSRVGSAVRVRGEK